MGWRVFPSSSAVLLAALLASGAAAASDWPTFAGGPRRLFFNPGETQVTAANVATLRVKWRFRTQAVITASPSVAVVDLPGEGPTQVVYVQSWDHTLYALRLRDGREVWRFATPDNPGASYPNAGSVDVSVVAGVPRVHFASEQTVYSLDARTGAELWHFEAGTGCRTPPGLCSFTGERNEVESSPLVADGKVFFGMDVNDRDGGKGGMYAVDVLDGRLVWFFDLESGMVCRPDPGDDIRRYDGYHSEDELGLPPGFLATRSGCNHPRSPNGCGNVWSSAAYDAGRGRIFIASSNCDTDSNPATLRPDPPMPPYDEAIFALALDGTPVWRWRPREIDNADLSFGAVPNLFTIDVDGTPRDVMGVGGKDGTYYVIDRDGVNARSGVRWDDADPSGLPYWRRNVVAGGSQGGLIATAAVDEANARIHFSTAPGNNVFAPQRPTVHAVDLHTGAILWQNAADTTADASFASVSAIPGVAFVGGASTGSLRSYDTAGGAKLGSIPISFVLVSPPAVVDGHVVLGGGVGQASDNPNDIAFIASKTPSDVTALCVPGSPACDEDQDGADFPEDCDDRDPRRNPSARELPGNAVDEDCDGFLATPDDACLTGGSFNQDRRDLDAVRATMEAACPCATFTGGPGRTRQAYRGCVRGSIRDALVAKVLRKRCKRLLTESTCGRPGSVICCAERRSTGSRACRARRTDACISSSRVERMIEAGATHCAATACIALPPTTTSTTATSTTIGGGTTTTTTSTLPPSWAAIQATLAPTCGGCHGGSGTAGGLGGLDDCATGYASLVGVPSTEFLAAQRVQPGNPLASWLVNKLDGTQGTYTSQCVGGSCGGTMPLGQPQLDPAIRDAVRTWIANGAANDCP